MTDPQEVRRRNSATLHRYFELLAALDIDAWSRLWAPECVQEMPFATGAIPRRVEGRDQVREFYAGMARDYRELSFADLEITELADPDRLLARWKPRGVMTDGSTYTNENVALFVFGADGLISGFDEYFDPVRAQQKFPAEGPVR